MIDYTKQSNMNHMISISNNMNSEIDAIDHMSRLIMFNKDVVGYIKTDKPIHIPESQKAISAIYDITNVFNNISSVFVVREDGTYINPGDGVTEIDLDALESSIGKVEEKAGAYILSTNAYGAISRLDGEPVISLIRVINDIETQQPIGMLIVNISLGIFEDTYQKDSVINRGFVFYEENSLIHVSDEANMDLIHLKDSVVNYGEHVTKNQVVDSYPIDHSNYVLYAYEDIRFEEILSDQLGSIIIIFFIVTALVIALSGVFMGKYITTPIEKLAQSMKTIKTGKFKRVSLKSANDEVGYLKDSYNAMLIELNELIEALIEKEKSVKVAELDALQEQIKPHFLYNTLETIGYISLTESGESAYDAIETLGKFYKKFLSNGSNEITLGEEVAIVKDYLKLQRLRYGEIFKDIYEIDPRLLSFKVPRLILQPLIENSLYHGIRPKGEVCTIKVSAKLVGNTILVTVYDTGIGIEPENIEKLSARDKNKSFGFAGTMERIMYYYNKEDIYDIKSVVGEYTSITIKIPYYGEKADV